MDIYDEKIESFFNQTMSEKEVLEFKEQVMADSDLKEALVYRHLAEYALKLAAEMRLRKELAVIKNNTPLIPPQRSASFFKLGKSWYLAAGWLLLFLASLLTYANLFFSNRALLEKYFDPPTSLYLRSDSNEMNEALLEKALVLFFKEKNYFKVMELLDRIPEEDLNYDLAQYYIASCSLKLGQFDQAISCFDQIMINQSYPSFVDPVEVEWNRMLAHLGNGNRYEFRFFLNEFLVREKIPQWYKNHSRKLDRDAASFFRNWVFY